MFSACAGVSSIASHTLAKRFLLIDLAPSTNPGNAARPAAALERPAGDACAIPKNRGSIPHPDGGQRHRRKTRITVSCPRCGIGAHFLILIMSRRPPRCRRAEANSPTLELTSGTDGPWFDLAITQWYPTDGRIGAPWRRSLPLAWS